MKKCGRQIGLFVLIGLLIGNIWIVDAFAKQTAATSQIILSEEDTSETEIVVGGYYKR